MTNPGCFFAIVIFVDCVGLGYLLARRDQEDPWVGAVKGFVVGALCVALMLIVSYVQDWLWRRKMDSEETNRREPRHLIKPINAFDPSGRDGELNSGRRRQ